MPKSATLQPLQHDFDVEPIQFLPLATNSLKLTIYGYSEAFKVSGSSKKIGGASDN